jgi:hypothetical protein
MSPPLGIRPAEDSAAARVGSQTFRPTWANAFWLGFTCASVAGIRALAEAPRDGRIGRLASDFPQAVAPALVRLRVRAVTAGINVIVTLERIEDAGLLFYPD